MAIDYRNRLPHLYLDETCYFLTARTIDGGKYFNTDRKKSFLKSSIAKALNKYNYKLFAWVILSNHYHLLVEFDKGKDLPKFIRYINSRSAHLLLYHGESQRCCDLAPATLALSKVWVGYWDRCIRNKKDFWTHFNYIHNNPIKHNYIKNLNELPNYKFSSYNFYLKKFGLDWLNSTFEQYPVVDFIIKGDE